MEANFNMLYELVLGLARSLRSLVSPHIFISSIQVLVKDEQTIQQVEGDMAKLGVQPVGALQTISP
jgi:hypothetical protein